MSIGDSGDKDQPSSIVDATLPAVFSDRTFISDKKKF